MDFDSTQAPLFSLASLYAACNVSILQTCTYSPQKRHDGSAFALAGGWRAGAVVRKVMGLSVSRVSPFVPV